MLAFSCTVGPQRALGLCLPVLLERGNRDEETETRMRQPCRTRKPDAMCIGENRRFRQYARSAAEERRNQGAGIKIHCRPSVGRMAITEFKTVSATDVKTVMPGSNILSGVK